MIYCVSCGSRKIIKAGKRKCTVVKAEDILFYKLNLSLSNNTSPLNPPKGDLEALQKFEMISIKQSSIT